LGHRNREPVDRLVADGATEAEDLAALAQASDILHICAPGSPQVEAIVDGLLAHLSE
jgi:3-hydroxyisobutyrate dehydrogenase-like beta-hydroxyacid dehydrogenase